MPGFMELLPNEQRLFNWMKNTIQKGFETFGFTPINTPIMERAEVILAKAGGDTEKQIYTVSKLATKTTEDIALRFDLTVPLARYVADHFYELTFPFRRYAIGKVYRGERSQAGRFKEFYQADIDVVGNKELSFRYDAELPSVIYTIFKKLNIGNFTIRINNRKVLNGYFESLGLSEQATSVLRSLDKLEKIGEDGVRKELEALKLPEDVIAKIFEFTQIKGNASEVIRCLKALDIANDTFARGVDELSQVMGFVREFGIPEDYYTIDLKIARGLDYYTSTVYETTLDAYPEIGSICSGGRYDNLASYFIDKELPGVGISIGLTRMFDQLLARNIIRPEAATPTNVLVIPLEDQFLSKAMDLANTLRAENVPTEVSFEQGSLRDKLEYANKLGIPYVAFIGANEVEKNVFTLKDFISGTQEELSTEQLISKLRRS